MAGHRGHQELVHGVLGGFEKVRRLGGVEATPASGDGQLVVEGRPEAKEALDGLAQG